MSYRRLRNEFGFDDKILDDIRHELIVARRLAVDEADEVLVWAGDENVQAGTAPARAGSRLPDAVKSEPAATGSTPSTAERRHLTVLFCDLVGSTQLSTHLDPEDLRDIISVYQDTCREAITQYDGYIAKFMGDGVLVYFGYPQAHEDDAERAVRAGLGILAATPSLNAALPDHDVEVAVRIGIATGPVVVGDIIGEGAAEEAAVVGETPNLAARLQGVADVGQMAISPGTHRLVERLFDFQDLGEHDLKGLAAPVRAWHVLGERIEDDDATQGYDMAHTPLVGRQEELGLLLRAWENSRDGHGQVVLIQGEAGIGKSRLLETLRQQVAAAGTWVAIRSSPYHRGSTLYPVTEHLKRVFRWQQEDTPELRLEKLETATHAHEGLPHDEAVPLIATLMSLPVPAGRYPPLDMTAEQQRDATLGILNEWLIEEAERRPMLLVWEDLHWADPTTVEMLGLLIDQVPTVKMLVVGTYRPEFLPPWQQRSHITPIILSRLERPEVREIVKNIGGGKSLPEPVLKHIIEKADGVPLFVEELTKTILESGVLGEDKDKYILTGSLSDVNVPETLQDSLMARLDKVPILREVAQLGAVLGREFAYEILQHLASQEEHTLQSGLEQLVERELLYQRGRGKRARYIFKHALIQDAAYDSLLKRTRQTYHGQVGRILEAQLPETVEAHPELLAHHFTEAQETERALEYWYRAAELAKSRHAQQEASAHLSKGIELTSNLDDEQERIQQELRFQISLGGTYLQMKGHSAPEVETTFARARQLCERMEDAPERVSILFGLWRTYVVQMADIAQPRDVAAQLLRLVEQGDDSAAKVVAHCAVGFTALVAGAFEPARDHLRKGIDLYSVADRDRAEVYRFGQDPGVACRCYLALAEWIAGCPDRARALVREGLELAEHLEDPFSKAFASAIGTMVLQVGGDLAASANLARQTIELSTEIGFPFWKSIGKVMNSWAEAVAKADHAHVDILKTQIAEHRALGTELFAGYFLTLLAEVALKADDRGLCDSALEEADALVQQTGERWWQSEIMRARTHLDCLAGQTPGDAAASFGQVMEIARGQGAKVLALRAAIDICQATDSDSNNAANRSVLKEWVDAITVGGDTPELKTAEALLTLHK